MFEGRGWRRRPENHEKFPGLRDRSIEIAHFGERGMLKKLLYLQNNSEQNILISLLQVERIFIIKILLYFKNNVRDT